jgi:hypothetical protein
MARSPDDRFPHLEGMRTELLRVAARLSPEASAQLTPQGTAATTPASGQPLIWSRALDPTVAAEGPGTTRSTARVPGAPPEPGQTEEEPAAAPGRPWRLGVGAAGVVLAGVLAVWIAMDRQSPVTPNGGGTTPPPVVNPPPSEPTKDEPVRPKEDDVSADPGTNVPPPALKGETSPSGKGAAPRPPSAEREARPKAVGGRTETPGGSVTPNPGPTPPKPAEADKTAVTPVTPGGTPSEPPKSDPPPPTVVVPPPPPPVGPGDEELIQGVLTRWARAYSARDARAVDEVQPGAADSLREQFEGLRSVEASLSGCRISVQQTKATADCAEAYSAELRVGGGRSAGTRRRAFSLDKSSGAWRITATKISR